MHSRKTRASALLHLEKQTEITIAPFGKKVSARGCAFFVRALDGAVFDRPIFFCLPFPSSEVAAVEKVHGLFARGKHDAGSPVTLRGIETERQQRGGEDERQFHLRAEHEECA